MFSWWLLLLGGGGAESGEKDEDELVRKKKLLTQTLVFILFRFCDDCKTMEKKRTTTSKNIVYAVLALLSHNKHAIVNDNQRPFFKIDLKAIEGREGDVDGRRL